MPTTPEEYRLIGTIATNAKHGNTEAADEARRQLRILKFERQLQALINAAPPLTDEARTRLATLLQPAGGE